MYDLYLLSRCSKPIDTTNLPREIKALPNLAEKNSNPGFLGLDLSANLAADLLELLNLAGGNGFVILSAFPSNYTLRRISKKR